MKIKKDVILCLSFLFLSLPAGGADQGGKLSLNELLSLAKERNPGLLALQAEVKAGQFRVLPQATLPDPVFSFSLRNIGATEFTVGKEMMSGVGFSVSQMIPFPGKLRLRGEIALTRVRRAEQTRDAYTLSLFRQLKELYARIFYYQNALEVLEKKKAFLEKALEAATIRYSVGGGAQNDVFKARLEISELEQMIQPMEQMLQAAQGQVNSLLNLPVNNPLGPTEEIPVYRLKASLEELLAAAQNSPRLLEARLMVEEQEKEVKLSRREFWPDLMVQVGKTFKGRFKDMYEVMVGVEVPIFLPRKQANLLEAAVEELRRSRHSFSSLENELQSLVKENYLMAKTAENLIIVTRDSLLPQASFTLESSLANYQVGKVDFLTLLTDIDSLYSYEMEYYRQLSDLWQAVSRLEELTGLNLLNEEKNENEGEKN